MNCTKVLHAFGPHPQQSVLPVDLAMHLCLTQDQPLYKLLTMTPLTPTKPPSEFATRPQQTTFDSPRHSLSSSSSFSSSSSSSPPVSLEIQSCFRRDGGGLSKKHVVFADAVGLALTAVRLFIPEPSNPSGTMPRKPWATNLPTAPISYPLVPLVPQFPSTVSQRYKLRLGFPPAALDPKGFVARLKEMQVQLESCCVTEHCLSGTVRVCSASLERTSVHIRLTFHSWRSYCDIPCTPLKKRYGGSDTDVFAFEVALPQNIDPKEQVEFCVAFSPGVGSPVRWDNNRGRNYRLCVETDGPKQTANRGVISRQSPMRVVPRPPSWPLCRVPSVMNSAEPSPERSIQQKCGPLQKSLSFPLHVCPNEYTRII